MKNEFKSLKVWQEAKQLAVDVSYLCRTTDLAKDFGLKDPMSLAAVSVPSNIAEGDERDTNKDSERFFFIAKGSSAELQTQLEIAAEVGLIAAEKQETLNRTVKKSAACSAA